MLIEEVSTYSQQVSALPEDVSKYGKHLIAAVLARHSVNSLAPTLLLAKNDPDWNVEEWVHSVAFISYAVVIGVCIDALAQLKMEEPIELPGPIEQIVARRVEQISLGGEKDQVPIPSVVESVSIFGDLSMTWLTTAEDRLAAAVNSQEARLPNSITKGLPPRKDDQTEDGARNFAISYRCALFIIENELDDPKSEDFLDGYISPNFTRLAAAPRTPHAETVMELRQITKALEKQASGLDGPSDRGHL